MNDEDNFPWYWGVAFILSVFGLFAAFWGFRERSDARDIRDHYEVCASVAETIEGFRVCTDHER